VCARRTIAPGLLFTHNFTPRKTLDHTFNGRLCNRNLGVNNSGATVGYSFNGPAQSLLPSQL
jgi:hypothetical protein